MGRRTVGSLGRPRVHAGSSTRHVRAARSRASTDARMADVAPADHAPPQYCPPQSEDERGVVRLPVSLSSGLFSNHSRCLRGRCWDADGLALFGPERVELTACRKTVPLPKSLAAKGLDEASWEDFLGGVREAAAASTPAVSTMCCFPLAFTLVLFPFVWCYVCGFMCCGVKKLQVACADRLEALARETDEKWRSRFGIGVELQRRQEWKRPYIPAEDAIAALGLKRLPLRSSTWYGNIFKFEPVFSAYA